MTAALRAISRDVLHQVFTPLTEVTVDQWADDERYLSAESSSEPGRWETSRTPYLREIMQRLTDPESHRIVVVKSAQCGGTEIINNWCGYSMRHAPGPLVVIQPSLPMVKEWSQSRFAPMLRDCPTLQKFNTGSRRRESNDTIERKGYSGGYVAVLSAGSTASLRSRPVGRIAADEVDDWEQDLGGQGDPLGLIEARATTFWDWKLLEISTPLLFELSKIWRSYRDSDRRVYQVPCPFCNALQVLRWRDGEGEIHDPSGAGEYRLVCERDDAGELIPESARYKCERCTKLIEERWKAGMLAAGRWHPTNPGHAVAGYRISGLMSPWFSWARLMEAFLRSKDNEATLKTFVNLRLGLPFKAHAERIESHVLEERAEPYGSTVPVGVGIVTAFADVQKDHLQVGIWGFGPQDERWAIAQEILEGDPGQPAVWQELEELLDYPLHGPHGHRIRIAALGVDANYNTDRVQAFCRRHHSLKRPVVPTIGRDGRGRPLLQAPGVSAVKRASRRRRDANYILGADTAKDDLAAALRVKEKGPGSVHFPAEEKLPNGETRPGMDPSFYLQLTSEELKTVYVQGRPVRKWVLPDGKENHALDCAGGCRAVLTLVPTLKQIGKLAERYREPPESSPPAGGARPATPPPKAPPRRSSWVDRY